jgi:hypothetical protein
MIVAQRPSEAVPYVPQVTPPWHAVAAAALPVVSSALVIEENGALQPIIWIKSDQRPDVGDLPRVLRSEYSQEQDLLVATQWLADLPHGHAFIVITYVEPVACTWAVSFSLQNDCAVLEQIATVARLLVALNDPPTFDHPSKQQLVVSAALPAAHVSLPIESPHHLRAILQQWAEYLAAR